MRNILLLLILILIATACGAGGGAGTEAPPPTNGYIVKFKPATLYSATNSDRIKIISNDGDLL
jgi:hypothetical protein